MNTRTRRLTGARFRATLPGIMVNRIPPGPLPVSLEGDPEDLRIARVNDLTRAGRANWFGLLAYLAFAMITLLAVRDADFFVPARQTDLPLIGVAIPTASFFYAAPLLGAALHVYLHLFVRKATAALMAAPAEWKGERLETHVLPWLLNDLVLRWRGAAEPRPLDHLATLTAVLLIWIAGPFVLGYAWVRSWPAHDPLMSFTALACLLFATYASLASWVRLTQDLSGGDCGLGPITRDLATLFLTLFAVNLTWESTMEGNLAAADLSEETLTPLPPDWLPYDTHKRRFRIDWCEREGLDPETCGPPHFSDTEPVPHLQTRRTTWCDDETRGLDTDACTTFFTDLDKRFATAWKTERATARSTLTAWTPPKGRDDHADLRGAVLTSASLTAADLRRAWLQGADLSGAQMEGADLSDAQMEGADLSDAQMEGANLNYARMEGADLYRAQMEGAVLIAAQMEGADLSGAQMEGANLYRAQMEGAVLIAAQMEGANLSDAQMEGAVLSLAQMEGAVLSDAQMEGADLYRAQMEGANLYRAQMEGADLSDAQMEGADLSDAQMEGADLYRAQMEGADLSGAQMEGAVLSLAQMEGADLSGAQMEGAVLSGAQMEGADLSLAQMEGAVLSGAQMEGADLYRAQMEGADLSGAQMEGADLYRAQMEGADLSDAQMEGAFLWYANLKSANRVGLRVDSAPTRFADFRTSDTDAQSDLSPLIGNAATLLPEDPPGQYVCTCWATEPPNWQTLVENLTRYSNWDEASMRTEFLCPAGERPRRTGTPWPADQPPPWGNFPSESDAAPDWAAAEDARRAADPDWPLCP